MLFFRNFPLKNSSIEQLFNDFLEKTNEKIAIPYRHFLKEDKSNLYLFTKNKILNLHLDFKPPIFLALAKQINSINKYSALTTNLRFMLGNVEFTMLNL